jgi:addiction module RelE/StbE family toxin
MWEIFEHRRTARQLKKLPIEILKRYEKWKDIVSVSGPAGLRMIRGFNDEALSGDWKGHRSSRLNEQYRVIYRIERNEVRVEVVSVTAHDYRRK